MRIGLFAIFGVGLVLTISALAYSSNAEADPTPTVVEREQVFLLDDGRVATLHVLIDTVEADPDDVMARIIERTPAQPASGSVSAAFALLRKWHPGDIPVGVNYNADFDPPSVDGNGAMEWAMQVWNDAPGNGFTWVDGGATDTFFTFCAVSQSDGENTVRFSYTLDDGVLGETCSITEGMVGGRDRTREFDMILDGWTNWSVAGTTPVGQYDLYSVMLHELGHALGLGHTAVPDSVMSPFIDFSEQRRELTEDDLAGYFALYGGQPAPTATSAPATPTKTVVPPTPASYDYEVVVPGVRRE